MYVLDKAYKVLEHVVSSNETIPVENGTREEANYEDRERLHNSYYISTY
jgi:hypothetical protein